MQVIHDPFLENYINSLGKKLRLSHRRVGSRYTFQVVNDPSINAFALPGGPTFVNTGLIKAADNEAQLAGVLAHEISHVALRHGTNQASKANLLQFLQPLLEPLWEEADRCWDSLRSSVSDWASTLCC